MTLVQNELKNAYIGEVYEYSYDFRGKTISWIQNDWWNIFVWSNLATVNSYWIGVTSWNTWELFAKIDKSWILNNAKKLTIKMDSTLVGSSACRLSYHSVATSSSRQGVTWNRYAYNSYSTSIYSTGYSDSYSLSWEAIMTTIVDLVGKTWTTTSSKWYTRSWTLTDTEVSNIRNNTTWFYINVSIASTSASWWIWSIYLLVE